MTSGAIHRSVLELSWEQQAASKLNKIFYPVEYYRWCTDTRHYQGEELFIAIKGERYDGASAVLALLKNANPSNIKLLVIDQSSEYKKELLQVAGQLEVWDVSSVLDWLQVLSVAHQAYWRALRPQAITIAVSGSNGKTTTKELIAHGLRQLMPGDQSVVATIKNNNNHLGVPLTVLQVDPRCTDVLIVECGSNHPGEIPALLKYLHVDSALCTNVGETHLEFFDSLAAVAQEEGSLLFHTLRAAGERAVLVMNGDDPQLMRLFNQLRNDPALAPGAQLIIFKEGSSESSSDQGAIHYQWKYLAPGAQLNALKLEAPGLLGKHNFANLVHSFLLLSHTAIPGLTDCSREEKNNKLRDALSSYQPSQMRSQWLFDGTVHYFFDAYNANPSSMRAALEGFKEYLLGQKIDLSSALIILGQMNELGMRAPAAHYDLGAWLPSLGFPHVCYVGLHGAQIEEGWFSQSAVIDRKSKTSKMMLELFETPARLISEMPKLLETRHYVLMKASRSLAFEQLLPLPLRAKFQH